MKSITFTLVLIACFITNQLSSQTTGGTRASQENIDNYFTNCTIGVASGSATQDGRPLLWKNMDTPPITNAVYYVDSYRYKFITVAALEVLEWSWMGVNEEGFAILNAQADDLRSTNPNGITNGELMTYALGNFTCIQDLENYLDSTNLTGRHTQSNFAVIDASGGAAIFETAGNEYWKFDANNIEQAPDAYLIRTNFTVNGGGKVGLERFNRSNKIISDFYAVDSLNYKNLLRGQMRDFSDKESNPIRIPYRNHEQTDIPQGYMQTAYSICHPTTTAAAVIHGVLPGERAELSTLWTLLGNPSSTIALPYWPVGETPELVNGKPETALYRVSDSIYDKLYDQFEGKKYFNTNKLLDERGNGLWPIIFQAEDSIFNAAELFVNSLRISSIVPSVMQRKEKEFTEYAYSKLSSYYAKSKSYVNIPDPSFKNYLLDQGVDLNKNGQIETNEAQKVKEIVWIGCSASHFIGLEEFTSLEILGIGGWLFHAPVKQLDLSDNYLLNDLRIISADVEALSLANNLELDTILLQDIFISKLELSENNQLNYLWLENLDSLYDICLWGGEAYIGETITNDYSAAFNGLDLSIRECPNAFFSADCLNNSTNAVDLERSMIRYSYPVPCDGILTINLNNLERYELFDANGKLILSGNETRIDMNNYKNGLYYLRLLNANGGFKTEKIVVLKPL